MRGELPTLADVRASREAKGQALQLSDDWIIRVIDPAGATWPVRLAELRAFFGARP